MIFMCAILKVIAWPFFKRTALSFIALAMKRSPAFPMVLTYRTPAMYSSVIHTETASMWPATHGKAPYNPNSSAHMSRFAYEIRLRFQLVEYEILCDYRRLTNILLVHIYIYIYLYIAVACQHIYMYQFCIYFISIYNNLPLILINLIAFDYCNYLYIYLRIGAIALAASVN